MALSLAALVLFLVLVGNEEDRAGRAELPVVLLFVGALFGIAVTSGVLGRVRRQRRVLEAHPWESRRGRYGELPGRGPIGGMRPLLLIEDEAAPAGRVLSLVGILLSTLAASGLQGSTEFEIAGSTKRYCVVRAPSSRRLLSARPPGTRRTERRWRRVFREPE